MKDRIWNAEILRRKLYGEKERVAGEKASGWFHLDLPSDSFIAAAAPAADVDDDYDSIYNVSF